MLAVEQHNAPDVPSAGSHRAPHNTRSVGGIAL